MKEKKFSKKLLIVAIFGIVFSLVVVGFASAGMMYGYGTKYNMMNSYIPISYNPYYPSYTYNPSSYSSITYNPYLQTYTPENNGCTSCNNMMYNQCNSCNNQVYNPPWYYYQTQNTVVEYRHNFLCWHWN